MIKTAFDTLKSEIIERLESGLSPNLLYHGVHHTRDDVLPAAIQLGEMANLSQHDMQLLKTAVLYHDLGYIQVYNDHEDLGAYLAAEELPKHGYAPEEIETIVGLIMATKMPHGAKGLLQEIICDADLDSLGREDFFVTSHCLRLELQSIGIELSVRDWYMRQLEFLKNHQYITPMAKKLRKSTKQKIIAEIENILAPRTTPTQT